MSWSLRYASHLGFRSFDLPLFLASVGGLDPEAHIAFAASLGFAGVQDPWFTQRPRTEQDRIEAAMRHFGLAAGCVVCGAMSDVRQPLWTETDTEARDRLRTSLDQATDGARRLGARQIAVLSGANPEKLRARQLLAMADNLAWAVEIVAPAGLKLCLEPTNARTLPGMLLNHIEEGRQLVRDVGSPWVRLIFDTAHVQSMDGDLLANLDRCWSEIEVIQIANHPGRREPAHGEINMAAVLKAAKAHGYDGLVELEHLWSRNEAATEQQGIEWLRRVDAQL